MVEGGIPCFFFFFLVILLGMKEATCIPGRMGFWISNIMQGDENRDSPERDMVNPSTDSYMWPIRGAP